MTQTATPTFFTQPITGPRQLVEILAPDLKLKPKNALIEIWLDSNSECFKFETHECPDFKIADAVFESILETGAESLQNSLILLLTFEHDYDEKPAIPIEAKALSENVHSHVDKHNIKLLDDLWCTPERWWSTMCTSEDCCPSTGRNIEARQTDSHSIVNVRTSWDQVCAIIERHNASEGLQDFETLAHIVEELCENITFRDCILSHCASGSEIKSTWETYLKQMAELPQFHKAMISTVLAAIAYLNNDLKTAAENLKISFERDPQYSLARLLRQGLVANAPASLLQSAFSVHTPEQLIAKSEK